MYCMCAVNNVRIILRREMLIKKIFWGILLDFLIPVLICFIILSIATGNWEDALIVLQEERRKCIILVLFIIFSNAIIVFAVGYCMVYSFQKDLIEKNRIMTDGDEAILEKDRTGKDGKLKICKDKYMKVDCKNRLLEKKKYRRASGDGE
mgnify:FL=1